MLKGKSLLKKVLGIALSLSLEVGTLLGGFSLFAVTAQADNPVEEYDLWIGEVPLTSNVLRVDCSGVDANNQPYSGYAAYDPDTNTLTLHGFVFNSTSPHSWTDSEYNVNYSYNAVISYFGTTQLNIVLEGENRINNRSGADSVQKRNGIYSTAPISFTAIGEGENVGKLTVDAGSSTAGSGHVLGIRSDATSGAISFEKGEVRVIAGTSYNHSIGIEAEKITVSVLGGTLSAESGATGTSIGIEADRITISGGTVNAVAGDGSNFGSLGIDTNYLTITGGETTAVASIRGNNYSIGLRALENATIENASLTAIGENVAIAASWSFTNVIPGTGWTDRNGTDGQAEIAVGENYSFPREYKKVQFVKHQVATVENGDGDGYYLDGATVTITADQPASGQRFAGWTSEDGVEFENASSPETTFVMGDEDVTVTATYTDMEYVSDVTFSPAGGTYSSAQNVVLSCATSDAQIYYTTDGTTPTSESTRYTGAINVSESKTIKAIAVKEGMFDSDISSATYTINIVDETEGTGNDDETNIGGNDETNTDGNDEINDTDDNTSGDENETEEKDAWDEKYGDNQYWQALDDLRKHLVPLTYEDKSGSPMYMEGMDLAWNSVGGKFYWYEGCIKQGTYFDTNSAIGYGSVRGREVYDPKSKSWFWLDSIYDGARAAAKEVWIPYIYQKEINLYADDEKLRDIAELSDEGMEDCVYDAMKNKKGKWIRYDNDGKMLKGWVTIEGDLAEIYPTQAGNTYYYDSVTGLMAKGDVTIGGVTYHFDTKTGVLKN